MSAVELGDRMARIADKVRDRGVQLGPRLTEDEIRRFEGQHGVSLPEGYRSFLLHVGNGGPGPGYGMAALGEVYAMHAERARIWTQLPYVREPFPFTKPWVWDNDEVSEEGTDEHLCHGSIYVGHDGCAMYWHLIVTGQERGNMWLISGEGMVPATPNREFAQWYEDWLDGPDFQPPAATPPESPGWRSRAVAALLAPIRWIRGD
jgi:hypothetical protein